MHERLRRGVTATGLVLCAATAASLTACGDGAPRPETVGAEAGSDTTSVTSPPPASTAPDEATTTTAAVGTTAPAPTTTTAHGPTTPRPSPVEGLTSAQLRTVVEAPAPSRRRASGPVADRVAVDGRAVWRVVVPGRFALLSSRVTVAVGGVDVGEGIVTPDLTRLVAVVADASALVDGAPVTYRWGTGAPIAAGPLQVVR